MNYICKYQNNYVSSYIFMKNIPKFLDKGISVGALFESEIFNMSFNYDEWPTAHTNKETIIRPYNESIFQIRKHYNTVFHEKEFHVDQKEANGEVIDVSKVFKIKYSVNILPGVGEYIIDKDPENKENPGGKSMFNLDTNLLGLISETEELEIFGTKTI